MTTNKIDSTEPTTNKEDKNVPKNIKQNKKPKNVIIPRGQPKSGRVWKTPKEKFNKVKKSLNRLSFAKKEELRNDIRNIKEMSRTIKETKKQNNELKKQRRIENAEKRLANERKAEIVQIIKNPAKIKRMKKKQLRKIEKRDLDLVKTK